MASNELTSKVRIDANQAHRTLDKLIAKIEKINRVVNAPSGASGMEKKINQAAVAQERLNQAALRTKIMEQQLTSQKHKSAQAAEKVKEATLKTAIANQRLSVQAERTQRFFDKLRDSASKTVTSTTNISKWVQKTNGFADKVRHTIGRWKFGISQATSQNAQFNKSLSTTDNLATRTFKTMKRLAATYLGIMGARGVMETSDTITSARNQLNNLPGGTAAQTEEALDKVYAAAQRSRGSYTDMLSNVGKTMTLAGDSFNNNIDNAIRFQEIMSKAYTVGGASAAEQTSSMYQLVQALGSGILQGDELRSLREGAPIAYKEIEKFAQGVLNTEESLKELASQGVITSDMVVAAIMGAEEKINKSFENTKMTFGQVITSIKNMAIQAFMPVLKTLENALNSSMGQAFIQGIGKALVILADVIIWIMNLLGSFFKWCAENWNWLKYVVIAVISAIIIALGVYTAVMIASAIKSAIAWLVVHWQMVLIIAVIAILVAAIVWLANTTKSGCDFMVMALFYVAIAIALIGLITGSTALLIVAIVIAVVALVIAGLNYIAGGFTWLWGLIKNVGLWIANLFLGVCNWIATAFSNAFNWIRNVGLGLWNSMKAIGQNIGIAFENGWIHAQNAFWSFISAVLKGIKWLEPAINAVAQAFGKEGVNISGTIANIEGKKKSTKSYVSVGDAWSSGMNTYSYKSLSDSFSSGFNTYPAFEKGWSSKAFNQGFEWGSGVQDKIGAFGDSLKNKVSKFNLDNMFASPKEFSADELSGAYKGIDNLGRLGDIDKLNKLANGGSGNGSNGLPDPNSSKYGLGDSYDPTAVNDDIDNALKKLGSIDDSTGSMADSMDLTEEDLEYLRKLAGQEWKKEYTTAEVKIDMSNYNTINSDSDLDGIVTRLADKLYDELDAVANGVYA